MTEESLAHPAQESSTTRLDRVADRIEAELHRLREKRPTLSDRIDRASSILVMHLALPHERLIRVRISLRTHRARFLVNGSGGAVYMVDPEGWQCSCPDAHRRGKGCKHSLAAFVLWRASRPAKLRKDLLCNGCGEALPRRSLVEIRHDHDQERYFQGDWLCRDCANEAGMEW